MKTLEQLTQVYWVTSFSFNGRSDAKLTIGDAISATRTTLESLKPKQRLRLAVTGLQTELIKNQRRKKPKVIPDNILTLRLQKPA